MFVLISTFQMLLIGGKWHACDQWMLTWNQVPFFECSDCMQVTVLPQNDASPFRIGDVEQGVPQLTFETGVLPIHVYYVRQLTDSAFLNLAFIKL